MNYFKVLPPISLARLLRYVDTTNSVVNLVTKLQLYCCVFLAFS